MRIEYPTEMTIPPRPQGSVARSALAARGQAGQIFDFQKRNRNNVLRISVDPRTTFNGTPTSLVKDLPLCVPPLTALQRVRKATGKESRRFPQKNNTGKPERR